MEKGVWFRVVKARRKMTRTTNTNSFNGGKRGRKATERGSERWEHKPYECYQLLEGKPYWTVLKITAWGHKIQR